MVLEFLKKSALTLMLAVLPSWAGTEVCGIIPIPTDWTLEGSPYTITNDIYIPPESRLKIDSGVTVLFAKPGPCKDMTTLRDWADTNFSTIKVDGAFYIAGTETAPVVLKPTKFIKGKIGWDGIRIADKSEVVVDIQYGEFYGANKALQINESVFNIHHSIFEWNNTGIELYNGSNVNIFNNIFRKNKSSGIAVNGSNPDIFNNLFIENFNYGIWSDSRVYVNIHHNGFWENDERHCFRCPAGLLELATENANGDSTDNRFNIVMDPIFIGSPAHKQAMKDDISLKTDMKKVKDREMAQVEFISRKNRPKPAVTPEVVGTGKFMFSHYSPMINAGDPSELYIDRDSSINDIGIHGGTIRKKGL